VKQLLSISDVSAEICDTLHSTSHDTHLPSVPANVAPQPAHIGNTHVTTIAINGTCMAILLVVD
jgi:hypothetical protein